MRSERLEHREQKKKGGGERGVTIQGDEICTYREKNIVWLDGHDELSSIYEGGQGRLCTS